MTYLWAVPVLEERKLADGDHASYELIGTNGEVVAFVLEAGADVDRAEPAALTQLVLDSEILEPLPPA